MTITIKYGWRDPICGEIGLLLDHKPITGSRRTAKGIFNLDGSPVIIGPLFVCGACGRKWGENTPKSWQIEELKPTSVSNA